MCLREGRAVDGELVKSVSDFPSDTGNYTKCDEEIPLNLA